MCIILPRLSFTTFSFLLNCKVFLSSPCHLTKFLSLLAPMFLVNVVVDFSSSYVYFYNHNTLELLLLLICQGVHCIAKTMMCDKQPQNTMTKSETFLQLSGLLGSPSDCPVQLCSVMSWQDSQERMF